MRTAAGAVPASYSHCLGDRPLLGETIGQCLDLVAEGAEAPTVEAIHEFAAGRLARYKIPRYVHLVDEYPLTASGKVRKVEMRQIAIDLLGLHQPAALATA